MEEEQRRRKAGRLMGGIELTEQQRRGAQLDLLRFTALNALSFEILAGQILILFARQVGASLSDIGLLAALLPFASVIQLGVAPLVSRYGPRKLMLVGWGARTVVAAALFLVPVAAAQGGSVLATRVLILVMAGFYLCRALGMSSWLPILQEIVPPSDRGEYLAKQEWLRQVSIVLIAVTTAGYLLGVSGIDRFMHLMAVGVLAAAGSLWFLARVPDVGLEPEEAHSGYFRRALSPLRDSVFLRYLLFSVTLRMLLSAVAPFLVVFLRDGMALDPAGVIVMNTLSSLGAIVTLGWWGRWSDQMGAKPALAISIAGTAGSLTLWLLAEPLPHWIWVGAPAISLVYGIFTGGLTVSMSKFELGFIPVHDRAHYVAMNVTIIGIGSAAATLAAGWLLSALESVDVRWGPIILERYRLFFLLLALALAVPFHLRRGLPEARARSLRMMARKQVKRRTLRFGKWLRNVASHRRK